MTTAVVHLRIPSDDLRWVEGLARRNQIPVATMLRALVHGIRIMAAEGKLEALSMGQLEFRPRIQINYSEEA